MKKYFFQVKREIPAERLLVFDVSEGWAPLCQFLGVAVPEEEPFPRTNEAAQQLARLAAREGLMGVCDRVASVIMLTLQRCPVPMLTQLV